MDINKANILDEIIQKRRATRIYTNQSVPEEVIQRSLKRATLAASSSNLQLWEFYHVKSEDKKDKLKAFCFNQLAARTAPELIVIVVRRDLYKQRAKNVFSLMQKTFDGKHPRGQKLTENYYNYLIPFLYFKDYTRISGIIKKIIVSIVGLFKNVYYQVTESEIQTVAQKSAALAAAHFMLSIAAEGYDSCPMEGCDTKRIKSLLNLPLGASINMVISVGKAADEGIFGERIRIPNEEVIFTV